MKKLVPALIGLSVLSTAHAKLAAEPAAVPGEVVVKLKPGMLTAFQAKRSLNASVIKSMDLIAGQFVVLRSSAKSTRFLLKELSDLPEVEYAEPNFLYKTTSIDTNDTLYDRLWGLANTGSNEPDRNGGWTGAAGVAGADINAVRAWGITKGSRAVTIAVIDTGIDYNHPDLKDNMWVNEREVAGNGVDDDGNGYIDDIYGWNAYANNGNPMDGNAHGTHCAGTIGARHDNQIGVAGVMNEVKLMAVKFLSDSGSGSLADAVEAIDYATKMNVDIMSNSWGGGGFSQALFDSITAASNRGILFVAAAGNNGTNNDSTPHYPSNYQVPNVISVAAHGVADTLASFSCFGARTVHVAAPGVNVMSSAPNNDYKVFSGTSMATPHVSGILGLLIAKEGRRPVVEMKERLMNTTVPGAAYRRKTVSGGRVNAYNFLTNTVIPRPQGPNDADWREERLRSAFETAHPYTNNASLKQTYSFPGAKYVKVIIKRYETETNYDFITLRDANGAVISKISGIGTNFETDYAETDSISLEFTSDSSETKWGVSVESVKVIY